MDLNIYSFTVQGNIVRLLQVIAHKTKLEILCGDIGNAYVNTYTKRKIYTRASPEFGPENIGKIIIIRKALYGL